jgi:hypothetical protein
MHETPWRSRLASGRGGRRAEVLESVRGVLIDEFGFDVVVAGEIFAGKVHV